MLMGDHEAGRSGVYHLAISKRILSRGVLTEKRVYLAQGSLIPDRETIIKENLCCVSTKGLGIEYFCFCDDFGPLNATSVVKFAETLQMIIVKKPGMNFGALKPLLELDLCS